MTSGSRSSRCGADMVGWRMIGFPGAYANYYDFVDRHGVAFAREPTSLAQGGHGEAHRGPHLHLGSHTHVEHDSHHSDPAGTASSSGRPSTSAGQGNPEARR
jgi:hypothetical protein